MTILQLTSHLDLGGITRYVLTTSQRLIARGHRVIVASDTGHRQADVERIGAAHWCVPLHTSQELSMPVWRAAHALSQRLRREPVDVIHAHTRVAQVIADRLSRELGIPYVTTWHGIFKRRLGRRLWPCTGAITIAISEPVRQHLLHDFRLAPERVRCIHNGIDPDYYGILPDAVAVRKTRAQWGIPDGCPIIGGVGRLASGRVKGFDLIVIAASLLERMVPNVHVVIAGDGPRRPFLEDIARRLHISERVHFIGSAEDVRVPLGVMDVFVFPSRWPEGFGLTLIEAMAAGKAVVATRIGAVSDIVRHDVDGWLVPPEDPTALAEGIAHLLQDRAAAARLGRQAQQRVAQEFTLDRMVAAIEAVYRDAASGAVR